jgi:hypothetical protein
MEPLRRRSVWGLLGSWVVYWLALAAVKLGPAAMAIWRATRSGPDQGSVAFNNGNWVLNLIVTEKGTTTWTGSIHVGALALWVGAVPLALWIIWLRSAARAGAPSKAGTAA